MDRILERALYFSLLGIAFFSPWSIAGAQISCGMAFLFFVLAQILKLKNSIDTKVVVIPVVIYLFTQFLASILAYNPVQSLASFKEEWIWVIYFMTAWSITRREQIQKIYQVLLGTSFLVAMYAIWQHFGGIDLYRHKSLPQFGPKSFAALGFFDHHLTYGGYAMLIFLSALVFWGKQKIQLRWKLLYGFFLLGLGLAVLFSYARSAVLGALAGATCWGVLKGKKTFFYVTAFVILVLSLVLIFEPTLQKRARSVLNLKAQSQTVRLGLWQTSWNMIKDKPILGIGPGNFSRLFEKYKVPGNYDTIAHPHNDYLNVLVNSGLIGFLGYLYLWFSFLKVSLRNLTISLPMITVLIGFFVAGLFQCYYTDQEVAMLLFFLLGLGTAEIRLKEKVDYD